MKLKLAVVAAFAADLMTTGYAFSLGAVEANPVMAGWSFAQIAAAKLAVLAGVLTYARLAGGKMRGVVLAYGAVTTGLVAGWNTWAITAYLVG